METPETSAEEYRAPLLSLVRAALLVFTGIACVVAFGYAYRWKQARFALIAAQSQSSSTMSSASSSSVQLPTFHDTKAAPLTIQHDDGWVTEFSCAKAVVATEWFQLLAICPHDQLRVKQSCVKGCAVSSVQSSN